MAKPPPPQTLAARLMSALVVSGILWLLLFLCLPLIDKIPAYLVQKRLEPYNLAFASGDLKRVRSLFERDLKGHTEDPSAYLTIAAICQENHRPDLAIEYLNRSLLPCKDAPRPVRANLYGALAECYGMVEKTKPQEQAILAAQRAAELDPTSPNLLNAFGYLLADNDIQPDEAVQKTSQALQLLKKSPSDDPTMASAVEDSYGWALYKKSNYDAAVGALNQAIADIPSDSMDTPVNRERFGPLYYHLGAAMRREGKTDVARQALQTALSLMPGNKEAKAELDDLNSHSPVARPGIDASKPTIQKDTSTSATIPPGDTKHAASAKPGEIKHAASAPASAKAGDAKHDASIPASVKPEDSKGANGAAIRPGAPSNAAEIKAKNLNDRQPTPKVPNKSAFTGGQSPKQ